MSSAVGCADCAMGSSGGSAGAGKCPPRMADGRHFTDYHPRCMANFVMHNETLNSFEYRQYLINNAETVMRNNSLAAYQANACGPCIEPYEVGTMLPEQYQVSCGQSTCKVTLNDQNGLGTGRIYTTAPTQEAVTAHADWLSGKQNEQAYFKKVAASCPGGSSAFPYEGTVMERSAVPSGAPLA